MDLLRKRLLSDDNTNHIFTQILNRFSISQSSVDKCKNKIINSIEKELYT